MTKYFIFVISLLLAGCESKVEQVYDEEKAIQVSLGDKLFFVPKKYIDNPSVPVPNPIVRGQYGSMNAYFYWPSLEGLTDFDEQQRFGRFNHYVIGMQWQLLDHVPVTTTQQIKNLNEYVQFDSAGSSCKWSGIIGCKQVYNGELYFFTGQDEKIGAYLVRCPSLNKQIDDNSVCNFDMDYSTKGLYLTGLISSSFVKTESFPKIAAQMKTFLDQWGGNPPINN